MVNIAFWEAPIEPLSRREESERARALLSALFWRLYGKELPTVKVKDGGKPYFDGSGEPHFNISHSGGAVAVVLSDTCAVGIDVQGKVDPQRAQRIVSRFPYVKQRNCAPIREYRFFIAEPQGEELIFSEKRLLPAVSDESFTAAWTKTEALLKAEGGGFASAKALDDIENRSNLVSFKIGDVYISVAKISSIC